MFTAECLRLVETCPTHRSSCSK